MAKYAIVSQNGKQYKLTQGEEVLVDLVTTDSKNYEFSNVLLVVDGDKVSVGTPSVEGAKVKTEIMNDEKGDKVRVVKYKAKSRYRRTNGFRHSFTRLKVLEIASS